MKNSSRFWYISVLLSYSRSKPNCSIAPPLVFLDLLLLAFLPVLFLFLVLLVLLILLLLLFFDIFF